MKINNKSFRSLGLSGLLMAQTISLVVAQTQTPPVAPEKQSGATTLNGATVRPPTTQQSALPAPALPLPKGDHPRLVSPTLQDLTEQVKSQALTINDVVAIALATNRTLAAEVSNYLQAQGISSTARAGLGPTLSTGYSFYRYNQEQSSNLGGQSIVTQQQYANQLSAALSLPIDITGELRATASQAKFQEIAVRLEINRVRNEIVLNTKNAFYNVLRNQALVKVAQDNLQNAVDRLADAQQRLEAGTVARYDVTTARTDVANAQQTLIRNSNALSQAFASLNSTLGIDINTPLQLTTKDAVEVPMSAASVDGTAPTVKPRPLPDNDQAIEPGELLGDQGASQVVGVQEFVVSNPIVLGTDYDSLLQEALKTRAEILREDANIAAARRGITVARAGLQPRLSAGYNLNYAPNVGALGQETIGYAGLTLSIPLFDSGATRGRVTQARSRVASAETNRRDQVDAVTLDVRQAYLNLQQAQQAIAAARQELAQADEAYRLARLRYSTGVTAQSGVSPLIELSNAQQSLSQAQSNYVNALYDFNNNRSALDKAAGRYSYTPGPLGFAAPPDARTVGRNLR